MWEINKYKDCIYFNDKIICEAPRHEGGQKFFEKYAKLIVSAPELLEALKEAKEVLIQLDHRHNGKCYNPGSTDCNCTLCKIDKVLKKSEC